MIRRWTDAFAVVLLACGGSGPSASGAPAPAAAAPIPSSGEVPTVASATGALSVREAGAAADGVRVVVRAYYLAEAPSCPPCPENAQCEQCAPPHARFGERPDGGETFLVSASPPPRWLGHLFVLEGEWNVHHHERVFWPDKLSRVASGPGAAGARP